MKVIGAGFGRTGTLSLRDALQELGFAPCYHMENVLEDSHAHHWQAILDGNPPQWNTFLNNFQAGVDVPISLYYKELMAHYPNAKVVLSVRDADRWYESVAGSIYQLSTMPRWMRWLPKLGPFLSMTRNMIWDGFFEGRFEDRALAIAKFEAHNAEVIRTVPADKLLVFSVKEGWEPLCHFLNVPIPDKPFPHVNDRAEMQRNIRATRSLSYIIPASVATLIALLIWQLS